MPSRSRAPARALFAAAAALTPALAPALAHADEAPPTTISGVVVQGQAPDAAQPLSTTSLDAERITRTINATTVEDTLKYLPSLLVRRRHIGDTQAPLATRTSGVGSSARSLIYADGVLLSALIGNNNSNASPRWSMVSADEVERVDVRYGPFSAAYPGNSIGAVVEFTTRKPEQLEGEARAAAGWQTFSHYGSRTDAPTYEASASAGDRRGPFWWRVSLNHLDSESQPLTYITATRPAATSTAGQPVTGAVADLSRTGAPIVVLGEGGLEHQVQDNAKLKLGWEITPHLEASYLVGYFGQDDDAGVRSYLRDASGASVYAGALNLGGYAYNVAPGAFANGLYRLKESHWMQALSLTGAPSAAFSWQAVATLYDYATDEQRSPSALPGGLSGGPGSILDLSGTGWRTFDLQAGWRPGGAQAFRAGLHYDLYELASNRYDTADWQGGAKGALAAASLGKTETQALWLEDAIRFTPAVDLTLGVRFERWRAFAGLSYSRTPPLNVSQPTLSADRTSPKAVLAWTPNDAWRATASVGLAYRFPTVSELYQAITTGPTLSVPDPNLAPERAVSSEVAVERRFASGRARLSLFTEDVSDALIAQTAAISPGSTTLVSFVQNIDIVRSRGAEAVVEWRDAFVRGLDLSASATFVDSKIARDPVLPAAQGKRTPQVPRFRWTAVASWRATERLTLTGAARYSDRVYATIDNSDPLTHTYQGFDGYLVADVRATYRLNDHWSAAVGVDNLGGRDYFLFHPFPQRSALAEIKYVY
ncbi:TonB-dependent receptor [Phenylobacterium hankyongense]|uniref:TonB-dependent receptor n=1 Tax=Phenylobacterium hankyongense TaxID=1813876 RepID=A0A328AZ20_9CAUL|nr:TonB-dependent receptor [Phenylobacterium hankyongense]RAK59837.1 TonB-dependent receptor [Phenylobacterium hankyongense]